MQDETWSVQQCDLVNVKGILALLIIFDSDPESNIQIWLGHSQISGLVVPDISNIVKKFRCGN